MRQGRRTVRAWVRLMSIAITCAGWRFRLNGKADENPTSHAVATGRAMARSADYAPAAMSRYRFRMRLAEANRRLTRSCIQLPV